MWALLHEISLRILGKQKKKTERKHRACHFHHYSTTIPNSQHITFKINPSISKEQETELVSNF